MSPYGPYFRRGTAVILLTACLWGLGMAEFVGAPSLAWATTTERIVTNRYSGLAIEGYDPLAYFIDGRPEVGSAQFEVAQGGVVWRFRNEGNRASFIAHPEVYGPQFGGYDPVDVARGVTVAGNPLFWLVTGQRLYLFAVEENRDSFAANPEPILKQATSRWPELEQQLAQ
jgi:YHS domain-containing protein